MRSGWYLGCRDVAATGGCAQARKQVQEPRRVHQRACAAADVLVVPLALSEQVLTVSLFLMSLARVAMRRAFASIDCRNVLRARQRCTGSTQHTCRNISVCSMYACQSISVSAGRRHAQASDQADEHWLQACWMNAAVQPLMQMHLPQLHRSSLTSSEGSHSHGTAQTISGHNTASAASRHSATSVAAPISDGSHSRCMPRRSMPLWRCCVLLMAIAESLSFQFVPLKSAASAARRSRLLAAAMHSPNAVHGADLSPGRLASRRDTRSVLRCAQPEGIDGCT